jgi:hypothetical protein
VHPSDLHSGGHPSSVCWKIMEIPRPESGNVSSKSQNNLSKNGCQLHERSYRSRPHSRTRLDENYTLLPSYSDYNCTYGNQLYSWFWRPHIRVSDWHCLIPLFPQFSNRWPF